MTEVCRDEVTITVLEYYRVLAPTIYRDLVKLSPASLTLLSRLHALHKNVIQTIHLGNYTGLIAHTFTLRNLH